MSILRLLITSNNVRNEEGLKLAGVEGLMARQEEDESAETDSVKQDAED